MAELGLAIGPNGIAAVEVRRTPFGVRPGTARFHPLGRDETVPDGGARADDAPASSGEELTVALAELAEEAGGGGPVRVSLCAPFAAAKVVSVPPVRRRDLRALVARNARRYFIAGNEPAIVDAVRIARGRGGRPARALAVHGCRARVEEIEQAIAGAGFRIEAMAPVAVALAAALVELEPAARRGRVVAALGSGADRLGLALEDGHLRMIEPWGAMTGPAAEAACRLARSAFPEAIAADRPEVVRVVIAGADGAEEPPPGHGGEETPRDPDDEGPTLRIVRSAALEEADPMAMAAFGAAVLSDDAPMLMSDTVRAAASRRVWRRRLVLAGAAALLLPVGGALHLWGLDRELRAVAAERRAIAADVTRTMEQREALDAIRARLEAIAEVRERGVRWSSALGALAHALPDSAYLLSVTSDGVRVRLAGVSRTAASAIVPALEASPWLSEVALATTERAEGPAGERFDLTVAFAPRPDSLEEGADGS